MANLVNSAPSAVSVAGTSAVVVVVVLLGLGLVAGGVVVALVILRKRVSKHYEAQEDDIEVDKMFALACLRTFILLF